MNQRRSIRLSVVLSVQVITAAAFTAAWLQLPAVERVRLRAELSGRRAPAAVDIRNATPVTPTPRYDDPDVVSDEDLARVLHAILPRFPRQQLRPNFVEHALRAWGSRIEFTRNDLMSGPEMVDYLLDTGQYIASWGTESEPILQPREDGGIAVRWASDRSASVHHDHMLASLAEAGVSLDHFVSTPARRTTLREIFLESLRDFRPDERETEWSAMAFAAWLAPQGRSVWFNGDGREISFDQIAARLLRSHKRKGVCLGTHRVYSLMMLVRLDERFPGLISSRTRQAVLDYLTEVRDLIMAAQADDGSWPPNWPDGIQADSRRDPAEPIHRRVIATGHHLEWLAIAPRELHPPREDILRAARWLVDNVRRTPQSDIEEKYTFYSHVGNALALWRRTTPAAFWSRWREAHPDAEQPADEPGPIESGAPEQ